MPERPLRVLHVVGAMNRAGVETWLMQVLRNIDRERFQLDFLVHTDEAADYDEEIRALGSRILPCLGVKKPWVYASNFGRLLAENGPYDIVHSHVAAYSGYVLMLAQRAGVRGRIAHSHSDTSRQRHAAGAARRVYLSLADGGIRRYATLGLAASAQAAESLFGPNWRANPRRQLLFCGSDFGAFREPADPTAREELGLAPHDLVVGHVGRFTEPKNHEFFVRVAARVAHMEPSARFLLVGDGPLRTRIEAAARRSGFGERFVFAGLRDDVPRLMKGAMDAVLFPSLWEGLPITMIESQAAAVPMVGSEAVPADGVVVPSLVQQMRLDEPVDAWAEAVLGAARGPRCVAPDEARDSMEQSPFSVKNCLAELTDTYERVLSQSASQAA